jgi:hypothetical protein
VRIPLLFPIFDEWIRYKHFYLPLQNNVKGITSVSAVHNILIHVHCLQFERVDQLLHIFILQVPLLEEFDGLQDCGNLFDFLLSTLIEWFRQHCLHQQHFVMIFEIFGFLSLFRSDLILGQVLSWFLLFVFSCIISIGAFLWGRSVGTSS